MDWSEIADWDDAYANAPHIPDSAGYPLRWQEDAAIFRAALSEAGRARLGLRYGGGTRQALDLFRPEGEPRGLVVFVHGGFWRAFGREDWSHLAAGPVARGWAVAVPSYTLAPEARISAITREIARALSLAATEVGGPIRLIGHSAGGHLVTRMVCRGTVPPELGDRITHVLSLSGLHDFRPLMRTALNGDLRLDGAEATAESTALLTPRPGTRLTVWVGADERPEFLRQSALLANVWLGLGAATRLVVEDGRHHFDVIDSLVAPQGALTEALIGN